MIETLTITGPEQEPLLASFYHGIYLAAFAAQREPLDVWTRALWSDEAPYRMGVRIALDGGEIVGGIAYELYPRSHCGLVTYVVVAPAARRSGLGRQLRSGVASKLYDEGARAVFGEVNDPRVPHPSETTLATWLRLERYQRWGSRVIDAPYVQPALGAGLERDRGLCLLRHAGAAPLGPTMDGSIVRDFVGELFEITESAEPDAELRGILDGIPDSVRLLELTQT